MIFLPVVAVICFLACYSYNRNASGPSSLNLPLSFLGTAIGGVVFVVAIKPEVRDFPTQPAQPSTFVNQSEG